jgi:hypothetical protein
MRKYRVPTSLGLFGNPASVRPKRFMQRSRFEPLLYHLRILLTHTVSTYVNGDFAELFEGGFEVFCDSQASMSRRPDCRSFQALVSEWLDRGSIAHSLIQAEPQCSFLQCSFSRRDSFEAVTS